MRPDAEEFDQRLVLVGNDDFEHRARSARHREQSARQTGAASGQRGDIVNGGLVQSGDQIVDGSTHAVESLKRRSHFL